MKQARLTWPGMGVGAFALALSFGAWIGCAAGAHSSGTVGLTTGTGGSSATGSTHSASGSGGGATCPGATLCSGKCTNTDFDPGNCGACGKACATGEFCSGGQCGATCSGGAQACGSTCTNPSFDPQNCGTCGHACAMGEVCSAGQCGAQCLGGTTDCTGKCVDTQIDPANCGTCGMACAMDQVCAGGQCSVTCLGGAMKCGLVCADTQNDPAHCGGCGTACPSGQVCAGGQCGVVCLGGASKCGSKCVDEKNDPLNCGSCGHACSPGQACVAGTCGFCAATFTQCNATCVDEKTDPKNCGACNAVCTAAQVCSVGACAATCAAGLTACNQKCLDTSTDVKNCGTCGNLCGAGDTCVGGVCQVCDSATTDCDGDGWLVSDGDCCDKPGLCGAQPELVNPGAIEVVGNGIDDNCNGLIDLFDTQDTVACDAMLTSNSMVPLDYAKAIGICRQTVEQPALLKDKTWGLLDAQILRADGSPLQDFKAISIRPGFGSISPATTEGKSVIVMSSGIASDATQTMPGPNGGAPAGFNVSNTHMPSSTVDLSLPATHSVADWYATANPPLKGAGALPEAPGCTGSNDNTAHDSVMLYLRLRAPTNVKAFSFNSYFMSAEYPEFVCTTFNDQFIALVDTPNGTPKPLANPIDKNLLTYTQGGQKWPIGINIAAGTSLFAVCDSQMTSPACWHASVSAQSCSLGSMQLMGTGFEAPMGANNCTIGGGTFWLTTAGNVIPGDIVELRISIWDVGDSAYDSLAVIDGFQWLPNATLPGTGG